MRRRLVGPVEPRQGSRRLGLEATRVGQVQTDKTNPNGATGPFGPVGMFVAATGTSSDLTLTLKDPRARVRRRCGTVGRPLRRHR
jgi:hypothetical protein